MKPSKRSLAKRKAYSEFRHKAAAHLKAKHGHLACLKCYHYKKSGDGRVDIDHIIRRSARSDLIMDVNNVQILCRTHHIEKTSLDFNRDFDNEKFLAGKYDNL